MVFTSGSHCILIVLFIVFVIVSQAISPEADHESSMKERHEKWMANHGRSYKDVTEKEKRYTIFKTNVEYIDSFNSLAGKTYKLGVNEFADLTNEEFMKTRRKYGSCPNRMCSGVVSVTDKNLTDLPASIDWRKKGAVTPIRGGSCGDWTFPAVDCVEGLTKIKTGKLYSLSVQEIVDCSNGGHYGCTGGFTYAAFEFIMHNGLTSEANYSSNGTCNTRKEKEPVAKINGYEFVKSNSEEALTEAVAKQPVAAMVDAGGAEFQFYSSGIFTGQCGTDLNHGVTIVGYGIGENGLKYWILKNDWTTSWGEDGYMRMERDVNVKEGLCGIAMEASYPTA